MRRRKELSKPDEDRRWGAQPCALRQERPTEGITMREGMALELTGRYESSVSLADQVSKDS